MRAWLPLPQSICMKGVILGYLHSRGIDLRGQAHTRQTAVESWHTLAYDPPVWTYGKRTTDGGDWLGGPLVAWWPSAIFTFLRCC